MAEILTQIKRSSSSDIQWSLVVYQSPIAAVLSGPQKGCYNFTDFPQWDVVIGYLATIKIVLRMNNSIDISKEACTRGQQSSRNTRVFAVCTMVDKSHTTSVKVLLPVTSELLLEQLYISQQIIAQLTIDSHQKSEAAAVAAKMAGWKLPVLLLRNPALCAEKCPLGATAGFSDTSTDTAASNLGGSNCWAGLRFLTVDDCSQCALVNPDLQQREGCLNFPPRASEYNKVGQSDGATPHSLAPSIALKSRESQSQFQSQFQSQSYSHSLSEVTKPPTAKSALSSSSSRVEPSDVSSSSSRVEPSDDCQPAVQRVATVLVGHDSLSGDLSRQGISMSSSGSNNSISSSISSSITSSSSSLHHHALPQSSDQKCRLLSSPAHKLVHVGSRSSVRHVLLTATGGEQVRLTEVVGVVIHKCVCVELGEGAASSSSVSSGDVSRRINVTRGAGDGGAAGSCTSAGSTTSVGSRATDDGTEATGVGGGNVDAAGNSRSSCSSWRKMGEKSARPQINQKCRLLLRDETSADVISVYLPSSSAAAFCVGLVVIIRDCFLCVASTNRYIYIKAQNASTIGR